MYRAAGVCAAGVPLPWSSARFLHNPAPTRFPARAAKGGTVMRDDRPDDDLMPSLEDPATQTLEKSTGPHDSGGVNRRAFIALSLAAVPAVSFAAATVKEVKTV